MHRVGARIAILAILAIPGCFLDGGDPGIIDRDATVADLPAASDIAAFDVWTTDTAAPNDPGTASDHGPGLDPGSAADPGIGSQDSAEDVVPPDDQGGTSTRCTLDDQCDDGTPCTEDRCVGGRCRHEAVAGECDDGNSCTLDDRCVSGKCVGGPMRACDDQDDCTEDLCKPGVGCVFVETPCDDGNPCTEDACSPSVGCVHQPVNNPCDDGDLCTTGDRCEAGSCSGGPALDCNDWNPCTRDWCERGVGCMFERDADCPGPCATSDDCDDGDACTFDLCNPFSNTCEHTLNPTCMPACMADPLQCLDRDPCTVDLCLPQLGCYHLPATDCDATCDPVNQDCDDGDPCTIDACDPFTRHCYQLPDIGCSKACRRASDCVDGDSCTLDLCLYGGTDTLAGACLNLPLAECAP